MKKHKILPIIALLLLLSMHGAACRSEVSSARREGIPTQFKDKADEVIKDANWEFQLVGNVPVERSPLSISCTSEGFCWLCNFHLIWVPANGGGWRQLPNLDLDENEIILGTFLMSPQVEWIVRSSGLYKTKDGGINWIRVEVPELDNGAGKIRGVYFRDENVGWVAGGKYRDLRKGEGIVNNALSDDRKRILTGCVLQTVDGGATWRIQEANRSLGRFEGIMFWNDVGIASGDAGCLVTTNGGKQWIEVLTKYRQEGTGKIPEAMSGFLLDDRNGWIALTGGKIIATRDGGKTWDIIYGPMESKPNVYPGTLSEISFVNATHGLALTREFGSGKLFKTSDGGRTWTAISSDERFQTFWLSAQSRRGILVGTKNIYSVSLK